MYIPEHFHEQDEAAIATVMADHPLASVVYQNPELNVSYLPLLRRGDRLIGHLAKANDMHRELADGADVLAIFHGADAYVSPNWYPSKAEHHKHVPTWNYQVVHVHGKIRFYHDEASKRRLVHALTSEFETRTNGTEAWKMGDAPQDFMRDRLADIVGLEIEITRIEGKSKLSQNRDEGDHENVMREMEARSHDELAVAMARHRDG